MTGEYPGVVCPVCNGTCVDAPAAQPQVPEGDLLRVIDERERKKKYQTAPIEAASGLQS